MYYIKNIPEWVGGYLVRVLEFRNESRELVARCNCLEWSTTGWGPDQFRCRCEMLKECEEVKKIIEELETKKISPRQLLMDP